MLTWIENGVRLNEQLRRKIILLVRDKRLNVSIQQTGIEDVFYCSAV